MTPSNMKLRPLDKFDIFKCVEISVHIMAS